MPTAVNTVLLSVSFKPISVDFTSVLNIVSLDRTSTVTMFAFATAIVLWYTIVVVQVYYELLLLDGYIYIASTPPPPPPPSPRWRGCQKDRRGRRVRLTGRQRRTSRRSWASATALDPPAAVRRSRGTPVSGRTGSGRGVSCRNRPGIESESVCDAQRDKLAALGQNFSPF